MRKSRFYPLSEETLKSYFQDLETAFLHSQNLFVLKYRCMEIGSFGEDEIVRAIVKIEVEWMKEVKENLKRLVCM